MEPQALWLSADKQALLSGLIQKSNAHYIDLETVLEWPKGVDRTAPPKREDHCWIYGTPHWERLSATQRLELLWQENARDASMFIWLEETLPTLFIGYLHQHGKALSEDIHDYMMIFAKEEIVHTLMFRRYMKSARLGLFGPPDGLQDLFVKMLPQQHPIAGVLCTFLVENVAEEAAMQGSDGPGVDDLTRKLYKAHHAEEARHLAFGRWICEEFLQKAPAEVKEKLGLLARSFMSRLVAQFTYNTEISSHLDFDTGISPADAGEVDRVRRSPNNRRINHERYDEMLDWMKRMGLAAADYDWF